VTRTAKAKRENRSFKDEEKHAKFVRLHDLTALQLTVGVKREKRSLKTRAKHAC
jgi:hypothetical protein